MLWDMKCVDLVFIVLGLCGNAYGFVVWNRTSVIDWQAGLYKAVQNQNSSTFGLASDDQPTRHDPHFVQISGGEHVLDAYQAVPIVQSENNVSSPSSNLHLNESSYQLSSAMQLLASQSAMTHDQALGVSATYQDQTYSMNNILLDQKIPSSQSRVNTNQTSESQALGQAGTTPASASQFVSASYAQSNYGVDIPGPAKWIRIFPGQKVPSLDQISGLHTVYHQPSTTGQIFAGQSVITQDQALSVSNMYPSQTSGVGGVLRYQKIPSSFQSGVITNQVSASQSASNSQGNYGPHPSGQVNWYTISHGQTVPSSSQSGVTNQAFGSSAQLSYQPRSATPVSTSHSVYTPLAQGNYGPPPSGLSNWYSISHGWSVPSSSQSGVTTNQASGISAQLSYQPSSTTLLSPGQSAYSPQAHGSYVPYPSGPANWYAISHGQNLPSSSQSGVATNQVLGSEPQSATQILAGQSALTSVAQSLGASTLRQAQMTNGDVSQDQSLVSSLQVSASHAQSSNQPSSTTLVSAGQSLYATQAQGNYGPHLGSANLDDLNIPSHVSGFQTQSLS